VGRHQDANALDKAALAARERVLGPEHPATLTSRNNLAQGYRAVGRHQAAVTLAEKSIYSRNPDGGWDGAARRP
jgi:Tetratricopeptide repeat